MEDSIRLLKDLVQVPGLSGFEKPIREDLTERWKPLTDEIQISKLGSVHGLRKATNSGQGQSVLIATHMDQIGLMVTQIEAGLLRITAIGGVDPRTMPGLSVTVHTKNGDLPGIVVLPPNHTLPKENASKGAEIKYLWIDTGLPERQVSQKVRLGNVVSFTLPVLDMGDGYISSPGLDNRASVAALTESLTILQIPSVLLGCLGRRHRTGRDQFMGGANLRIWYPPYSGSGGRCQLCQRTRLTLA